MSTGRPDWGAAIRRAQGGEARSFQRTSAATAARMLGLAGEERKDYSAAQRKELAAQGKALPGGEFPIVDKEDLANAATLYKSGHHKTPDAAAHIRKRAAALGVPDPLAGDKDGG